jgi:hypothetical protein
MERDVIQAVMCVVGVYYALRLLTMQDARPSFGLSLESREEWRRQKVLQYRWGIIAGWGSLLIGVVPLVLITANCPQQVCTAEAADPAVWVTLISSLVVLIVGVILSVAASNRARRVEQTNSSGTPSGKREPIVYRSPAEFLGPAPLVHDPDPTVEPSLPR